MPDPGAPCEDASPCDGYGTCSPAGRCLEDDQAPPPDSDPCTLDGCSGCTPIDRTVATYFPDAYTFLYTGANAVQSGLNEQALQPERVSVVRGRVLDRAGDPVHGAQVTVLPLDPNEPEFGETHSLSDGYYQMVTHGGGEVTVVIDHPDYLPVMRREFVFANDARYFGDVVLTPPDVPTAIDLDDLESSSTPQLAESTTVSDGRGPRQMKVLFKPGTTAEVVSDPLDPSPGIPLEGELGFRITEYTVGETGPQAMPAPLPPSTDYTYAAALRFEGIPADQHVRFSQPVITYLDADEFLPFEAGSAIPAGWLNRSTGAWIAGPSGTVLEITGTTSCGGGTCATVDGAGGLTLDTLELQTLAAEFSTGDLVWRVPMDHLTDIDLNLMKTFPLGSFAAWLAPILGGLEDCPTRVDGSEIECDTQVLGEAFPVVGTPLSLHYRSDRVAGRRNTVRIPLGYFHPDLVKVDVSLYVAGRLYYAEYLSTQQPAEQVFEWDHRDFLGRLVQGSQKALVTVGLTYEYVYSEATVFNLPPQDEGVHISVATDNRLQTTWAVDLGQMVAEPLELGGLTIGQHHFYDPTRRRIYHGNGRRQTADAKSGLVVRTVVGGQTSGGACPLDTSADPFEVNMAGPKALATGPDGSLFVADSIGTCNGVRVVTPAGAHSVLLDESGTDASIGGIAIGPDGSVYLSRDVQNTNARRVDRLVPNQGAPVAFAGTGDPCVDPTGGCGDGGPALMAELSQPEELAVAPDGTVFIADRTARRIRRVDPAGIITTIAGNGATCTIPLESPCVGTEGGLATAAAIGNVANMALMKDGTIVFEGGAGGRIMAVTPQGRIFRVMGFGDLPVSDISTYEGAPANQFGLVPNVRGLAASPDGRLLVSMVHGSPLPYSGRVVAIRAPVAAPVGAANGPVATIAGGYQVACTGFVDCGEAVAPTATQFTPLGDNAIAVAPDGRVFVSDASERVFAIQPVLPTFGAAMEFASDDGLELYVFDFAGRHLETRDARTGTPLLTFDYADSLLTEITDADGRATTIERTPGKVWIEGPFGDTTELTLDGAGTYATSIKTPALREFGMMYDTGDAAGLLLEMTTPRSEVYTFTYDTAGALESDADPAGGLQTLAFTAIEPTSSAPAGHDVTLTRKNTAATTLDVTHYRNTWAGETVRFRETSWPAGELDPLWVESKDFGGGKSTQHTIDGSSVVVTRKPDPRFGMLAPIPEVMTSTGGFSSVAALTRAPTFGGSPAALQTLTETVDVDGDDWVSVLNLTTSPKTEVLTTPEGRTLSMEVNALLRPTKVTIPGLEPLVIAYIGSGSTKGFVDYLEQGTGGEKRTVDFQYDASGRLWKITDPLTRVVEFAQYDDDRLPEIINLPGSGQVVLGYDDSGNLTSVDPPGTLAGAHAMGHSLLEFLSTYTPPDPPDAGVLGWTFTEDRQLEEMVTPLHTITALYDAYGRVTSVSDGADPIGFEYFTFNGTALAGKLDKLTRTYDSTELSFDYAGSLIEEVALGGTGPVAGTVQWGYQTGLLLASETVVTAGPSSSVVSYLYDNDRLLQEAGALVIARDPSSNLNGLIAGTTLGADSEDIYGYNGFGEIQSYQASHDTAALYEVYYQRDLLGRVIRRAERLESGDVEVREYSYHARGWLQQVDVGTVASCTLSTCNCGDEVTCATGESYTYDANGNRETASGSLVPTVAGTDTTYDAQDRQTAYGATTSFAVDSEGRRWQRTVGSDVTEYVYTAYGELAEVTLPGADVVTYVLDPLGRRVGKKYNGVLERGWLWGSQHGPVAELAADGVNLAARFVYGTRSWVPDYMVIPAGQADPGTYRIISDQLGSVRLVVDISDGDVKQRMDYDSFGRVIEATSFGYDFQPFGFAGGLYDRDTGLVQFGAREYDPEVGRWLTKDPILLGGGINLYLYVDNDPVNSLDPDGLWRDDDVRIDGFQRAYSNASGGEALGLAGIPLGGAAVGLGGLAVLELAGASGIAGQASTSWMVRTGVGGLFTAIAQKAESCKSASGSASGHVTTLFHGGKLVGGKVQPGNFSTTPSYEHAAQYAAQQGGQVYRFQVPTTRLYQMQDVGGVRTYRDLLKGTSESAIEWRFVGPNATELNKYLVP